MENLVYQEEIPEELIAGKIVPMWPRPLLSHHEAGANIAMIFWQYLKGKDGKAFRNSVALELDEQNVFFPDVMIVCNPSIIHEDGIYGTPDLVVEVLSPSTAARDRGVKKDTYARAGVREYWLVDPLAKSVEVYLLQDVRLEFANAYTIYPEVTWNKLTDEEKAAVPLTIKVSLYEDFFVDVREIFEDV